MAWQQINDENGRTAWQRLNANNELEMTYDQPAELAQPPNPLDSPALFGYGKQTIPLIQDAAAKAGVKFSDADIAAAAQKVASVFAPNGGWLQGGNSAYIASQILAQLGKDPKYAAGNAAWSNGNYYDNNGQVYKQLAQEGVQRDADLSKWWDNQRQQTATDWIAPASIIAAFAGGQALLGSGAGAGGVLSDAALSDSLATSELLGTGGAISSGGSGVLSSGIGGTQFAGGYGGVPDAPVGEAFSGGGAANVDPSSFGQSGLDSSAWDTGIGGSPLTNVGADTAILPNNGLINLGNSGLGGSLELPNLITPGGGTGTGGGTSAAGTTGGTGTVTSGGDVDLTGIGSGTGGAAAAGASGLWSRILDGTATADDWAGLAGKALPGLLGAFGASQQTDALKGISDRAYATGAPSRARFEASMTPGFDPRSIAGYSGAVDTASESLLRKLSANGGNPFGNPGGLIEANKAIINGTALPAIQNYQNTNAAAGGLGAISASYPGAATSSVNSGAGVYNGIGAAVNDVMNPQPTLDDLLKKLSAKNLSSANGLV